MATKTNQEMIPANTIATANPDQLMHLVLGAVDVRVDFPEGTALSEMESTLGFAVKGYQRLQGAAEKLKPIIGRILLTVKNRKAWKGHYKNFTAFYTSKVIGELGLSKSVALEALKIASAFPSLTPAQYAHYGATRLLLAARVTDSSKTDYKAILDESVKQSIDEFRNTTARLYAESPARTNRARPFIISVRVDETTFAHWKSITEGREDVAAFFGEVLASWESHTPSAKKAQVIAPAKGRKRQGVPSMAELEAVTL